MLCIYFFGERIFLSCRNAYSHKLGEGREIEKRTKQQRKGDFKKWRSRRLMTPMCMNRQWYHICMLMQGFFMFSIMYTGADDLHKYTECPDTFDLPSGVGRKTKRGIWIICYDAGISHGEFVQLMEKMVFKEESYSFNFILTFH